MTQPHAAVRASQPYALAVPLVVALWAYWPALTEAILGNIIPDFPVINKSFNLSYSGTDR